LSLIFLLLSPQSVGASLRQFSEASSTTHRRLIVGGAPAPRHKYDAVVWSGGELGWGCGGAMVARDVFLTAAHCESAFESSGGAFVGAYFMNATHYKTATPENGGGTFYKLAVQLPHPRHKEPDHDVMLVKLKHAAVETPYEINRQRDFPLVGEEVGLVGFGVTKEGGKLSPVLKEVNVNVYGYDLCYKTFHKEMGLKISDDLHLCTGTLEGGRDGCDSDSGTPLLVNNTIVGVTNDGVGCARPNVPAYNARVSAHADWIDEGICALSDFPPQHCLNYPFKDETEPSQEQVETSCNCISLEAFVISMVFAFVGGAVSTWMVLQRSRHCHQIPHHHKLMHYDSMSTAETQQLSPALSTFSDKY
jgi:hypothetical protein